MATCPATSTIHRDDILLVKPSQPTPSNPLSFSSVDNDPNLEILCQTIYVYKTNPSTELDPATVIQEALSKVLVYFYPLAGKLKRNNNDGELQIVCTGEGVPFLAAKADCTLESLHYFEGSEVDIMKEFVFEVVGNEKEGAHPLVIQVTKFACGGFTIGMGLYHTVCDGFGAAQFFRAMAELASGKAECTVKPVWERERLVGRATNANFVPPPINSFATSPFLPTTDLVHESFTLGSDCISRLKTSLLNEKRAEDENENFTTLEVLSAYIWRARFKSLEMNLDGKTSFSLAIGIRHLLDPPLPNGYYGNAFVSSHVALMGKDLIESPLSRVVRLIKDGKRKATKPEYISSWLDILESINQNRVKLEGNGASMVLTDWRQLGLLEEVDFGWKEAVNVFPIPWKIFGYVDLCIFLPPCKLNPTMKGGVRVLVCLPRAAMTKFKQEMDALKLESD
ncbi:sphingosine N-acyltransferase [Ranunculus cassubicifolius]